MRITLLYMISPGEAVSLDQRLQRDTSRKFVKLIFKEVGQPLQFKGIICKLIYVYYLVM